MTLVAIIFTLVGAAGLLVGAVMWSIEREMRRRGGGPDDNAHLPPLNGC